MPVGGSNSMRSAQTISALCHTPQPLFESLESDRPILQFRRSCEEHAVMIFTVDVRNILFV
jgi:hypothetical protein